MSVSNCPSCKEEYEFGFDEPEYYAPESTNGSLNTEIKECKHCGAIYRFETYGELLNDEDMLLNRLYFHFNGKERLKFVQELFERHPDLRQAYGIETYEEKNTRIKKLYDGDKK